MTDDSGSAQIPQDARKRIAQSKHGLFTSDLSVSEFTLPWYARLSSAFQSFSSSRNTSIGVSASPHLTSHACGWYDQK